MLLLKLSLVVKMVLVMFEEQYQYECLYVWLMMSRSKQCGIGWFALQ